MGERSTVLEAPPSPVRAAAATAEALVRRFELTQGRQLLDTRQGGWVDMPSEAVPKALALWRLELRPSILPVPRYLSVRDGQPQRFVDIHVLTHQQPDLTLRQSQLLRAAEFSAHTWLYVVPAGDTGDLEAAGLLLLQDPARAAWASPQAPTGADPNAGDPIWRLPRNDLDHQADRVPVAA